MSSSGPTGNAAGAAASGGTSATNTNASRRRWPQQANTTSSAPKALNQIPELAQAVFDFGPTIKPDHFQRTRLAIETYIQTTYKEPRDIVAAIRTLEIPPDLLAPPARPKKDPNDPDDFAFAMEDWKNANTLYNTRKARFASHEANAWGLIFGQCSAALRTELTGTSGFDQCRADFDVVALLTMIEAICS